MSFDGRIIISFNNLAKAAGLDPEKKTNFTATEKKELLAEVQKHLDVWVAGSRPFMGAVAVLDPDFAKKAPRILHAIHSKRGDSISLDALAAYYVAQSEEDEDIDEVKENIRILVKQTPEVWAMSGGPSPKVIRMKTANGKETGAERPKERAPRGTSTGGASLDKRVERFTSSVRGVGITSKAEFERAKVAIGSQQVTLKQLSDWVAHNRRS